MKMWEQCLLVCMGVISINAIQIPLQQLQNTHTNIKTLPIIPEQIQSLPIYYESEETNGESYLIPHELHEPEDVVRDVFPTPATYLLPPSPDKQNEYFVKPTEPGEQTDWFPIAANPAKQQETIIQQEVRLDPNEVRANLRTGKILHRGQVITVPSRSLLPPRESAQDDFIAPSAELELPSEEIDHTQNQNENIEHPVLRPVENPHPLLSTMENPHPVLRTMEKPHPVHFRVMPESPVPYITPPEKLPQEYKNPTRLYPKKYINEFKPIPIPISKYKDDAEDNLPTVKPQSHDMVIHHNVEYLTPLKHKKNYLYEESQKKRNNQKYTAKPEAENGDTNEDSPAEQETSESIHRHPGNHVHPTYPRKESVKHKPENKSKGERTEFRMHGMKGPNSYQFGYDTGKGKNRQFRYEERDNDGHVRGHYGYVDKFGKLRVVNYDADPELGFRADAPVVKDK